VECVKNVKMTFSERKRASFPACRILAKKRTEFSTLVEKYLKFVTKKPAVRNIGNLRRARGATDGTDGDRWLWGAPTLSGAKWLARRVPG
jgi:hypothetical protein